MEANVVFVGIAIEVIDARRVEGRRAPLDAVHDIALAQQQFGKISAVLPGRAGDQRRFGTPVIHPQWRRVGSHQISIVSESSPASSPGMTSNAIQIRSSS